MRIATGPRYLALALVVVAGAAACSRSAEPKEDGGGQAGPTPSAPTAVRVARVETASLPLYVSGPGKTVALSQQKVRAPFAGTLTELRVSDGDRVRRGESIGAMVARESEAALSGARQMVREAVTPAQRADAQRALALAEGNVVRRALVATSDGTVASHAASAGDRLAEDQEILTINDAGSLVFVVDLPQSDLPRVRVGQKATVAIAGSPPMAGSVHAILPAANTADFTGSVRVDLPKSSQRLALGVFGTANVLVEEHRDATVVPDAAVLRDDVTGVTRVALVQQNRAHWVDVRTGLRQNGRTEILSPAVPAGQPVVVSGLVGLPEGKLVAPQER